MVYIKSQYNQKYNKRTYQRWYADIRPALHQDLEVVREDLGLSRAELLVVLLRYYHGGQADKEEEE